MNFVLFLILNALILLRPEDLFPQINGLRLYLVVMVLCLATSISPLASRLSPEALRNRPIGVCVIGIWIAGFFSFLFYRFRLEDGIDFLGEFGKVVIYYFLFVALVDTRRRFWIMIRWLIACLLVLTIVAILDYYQIVDFDAIKHARDHLTDPESGEEGMIDRLCYTGIYSDPNDLCLALTLGMLISAYLFLSGSGTLRLAWLIPIIPFGYALTLTHSKGGLLGLMAGVAAWLYARYGGKKALPLAALAIAGLLALIGGRSANISGGGTAHMRLMGWAEGLSHLIYKPLYLIPGLGVGYFADEFGLVGHNSFITRLCRDRLARRGLLLRSILYHSETCRKIEPKRQYSKLE